MTLLAVSVMVDSLETALTAARRARDLGADLVEFRIDRFADRPAPEAANLVAKSPLPCIVTCRPRWEGGEYDGDEQTRVSLLEFLGTSADAAAGSGKNTANPAFFDVEWQAYRSSANLRQKIDLVVAHDHQVRDIGTGLILSSHDFSGRPGDLKQRVSDMAAAAACRVVKVAWKAGGLGDNLAVFELLRDRTKDTIALCMGEAGLPSRVLAKKFGGFLTFAALDGLLATAPGQPTIEQLKGLYRWDVIGPGTKVYGVIGWPVGHSLRPAIHNAGFAAVGHDGVYLPLPIEPSYEAFKEAVGGWLDFDGLDFVGASVTMPHKENLLRFVAERGGRIDPLAELIGAANTLTRHPDGTLEASNTDCTAAVGVVRDALQMKDGDLKGVRVAVIGSGGVARAVVVGMAGAGATVVVYNRTKERAEALAAEYSGKLAGKVVAARLDKLCDSCCQVIVNCTPVGMAPNVNASPLDGVAGSPGVFGSPEGGKSFGWGPGTVVFDTIYNPAQTKLLRAAHQAGCTTVGGREMFVRQAAGQFEPWTGHPAPVALFREVLAKRLGE